MKFKLPPLIIGSPSNEDCGLTAERTTLTRGDGRTTVTVGQLVCSRCTGCTLEGIEYSDELGIDRRMRLTAGNAKQSVTDFLIWSFGEGDYCGTPKPDETA